MTQPLTTDIRTESRVDEARSTARSFLKWAGGKKRLLSQLHPLLPVGAEHKRYFEPFAGGLSLFFHLAPQQAWLGDINPNLMTTYNVVRNDVAALGAYLASMALSHTPEQYYQMRAEFNAKTPRLPIERAALFIYLNRTCYNGLHRVNARGEFNVPLGRYKRPRIHDADRLRKASQQLANAQLRCGDFSETVAQARCGDFVYLDPPYLVPEDESHFTRYARQDFTAQDQVRLWETFRELDRRGCFVMLSNSATGPVRELYRDYPAFEVTAPRSIGAKASSRGSASELVICNYQPTLAAPVAH